MQKEIDAIFHHMAQSHQEIAKILQSKRQVTVFVSKLVQEIPDASPSFGELENTIEQSMLVAKNVTAYLNSLADLEEAIAYNLSLIMRDLMSEPVEE